ncbi:hypothetical protein SISNIDRAFT_466960 [Sistotremastrum niveocremeum HHB9708]|uniref:Retrovirus-related Pol polyprotein from transposon TNT 1-94-like beta-barrel domain-containing protein n=1 Tax=Sistotremastrum niveocremeum HHB9708 TaxID=1314777 RepID=A0A164T5J4_9AGAM|nr:hypothetical protein SISNIDRAFT_466960 [Sistotremastrum niveocremeum HHB9708]
MSNSEITSIPASSIENSATMDEKVEIDELEAPITDNSMTGWIAVAGRERKERVQREDDMCWSVLEMKTEVISDSVDQQEYGNRNIETLQNIPSLENNPIDSLCHLPIPINPIIPIPIAGHTSPSNDAPRAYVADFSAHQINGFVIDSGATRHITDNINDFISIAPTDILIKGLGDHGERGIGVGTIRIKWADTGQITELTDVLYAPKGMVFKI